MSRTIRLQIAIAGWLAVVFSDAAFANNNLFLPGDAFFPTVLTADELGRLKADPDKPPVFEYSSFGGYEGAFCGYARFNRGRISDLDAAFIGLLPI